MYFKRLIIVTVITYLVASGIGALLDQRFKKRWSALFFESTTELIKGSTNHDIIFIGNSRVHSGINPYYIDSVTKLNSYNFGIGGAGAADILLTSTLYLQQHPAPKLVVISLNLSTLLKNDILKTRYQYLFFLGNDTINKYMRQAGFLTTLVKIFPFLKYSFFDEYNRTSLFVKGKPYPVFDHNIYKGFININQHVNGKAEGVYNSEKQTANLWDSAIMSLKNVVVKLQRAGCMIVFVSPPKRSDSGSREDPLQKMADTIFAGIAANYQVKWLHFENDPMYTDEYFSDEIHLNEPGTKIYSKQLADSIKSLYPYQNKSSH